jgi:hypothetical protein
LRIIGAKMIAYNDITRKAIATIELKKAVSVLEDREPSLDVRSPDSAVSARSSRYIDHDGPYGIERAFKLVFQNNQEITFFADTDEEKAEWYIFTIFSIACLNTDVYSHLSGCKFCVELLGMCLPTRYGLRLLGSVERT